MVAQSFRLRLTLAVVLWLMGMDARAQQAAVPVALSTRAPEVEWGTLPAKQVLANKSQARVAGEPERDEHGRLAVHGLRGTLNKDDVHQTMDARQRALNGCIQQARRGSAWVGGALRFAFRVDGEGRVIRVRPLGSSLGHLALERCISQVLKETQFPPPSGRATADFTWGMKVEPARGSLLKPRHNRGVAASVRKHSRQLRKLCSLPRRARYRVTAYVSASGKVVSAGAITRPGAAEEKLECLIGELSKLRLPKQKRMAKVQFDVR